MDYFPENKTSFFITKLKDRISLTDEWEVGLSEIFIPKNWHNITPEHVLSFDFADFPSNVENYKFRDSYYSVRPGYYPSLEGLVEELNILCTKHALPNDTRPKFFNDRISSHIHVWIPHNVELNLSPRLASVLGFHKSSYYNKTHTNGINFYSDKACDVKDGIHSMFVYCDVAECVPVGDTAAPLLKIINIDGTSHGDTIHRYYDRPSYVPLQKLNFETLEIHIKDCFNEYIPFQSGTAIATLHFRRVKASYFSK